MKTSKSSSIVYFEREGRENLVQVLRIVKRALKRRPELRKAKLVIFTAEGEGPALAFSQLQQYEPQILAVTFPPDFFARKGDENFYPRIHSKVRKFFEGVGIKIITSRLPFDPIEGANSHNQQMDVIRQVLGIFGGSLPLAIQAVLQACDGGEIEIGERVISITGDCALIITASTTRKFLSKEEGLIVNEILCKPTNMTITRATPTTQTKSDQLFGPKAIRLEAPASLALSRPTGDPEKR